MKKNNTINVILKTLALLIPIMTAGFVIYNQFSTRQMFYEYEQGIIKVLSNLKDSQIIIDENLKNEIVIEIQKLVNNDLKVSMDLLIGLFGIVISVWVGLNVYNILKKDDLDELASRVETTIDGFDCDLYKNKQLQTAYLCKSFDIVDNSSYYFNKKINIMDVHAIEYEFVLNAILIEHSYTKLRNLYKHNNYMKMDLFVDQGIEHCENVLKAKESSLQTSPKFFKSYAIQNNFISGYINYRYGDFLYFKAMKLYYGNNKRDLAFEHFKQAIDRYISALEYDTELAQRTDIYNMIGFIYIKMYDFANNQTKYQSEMDDWRQNALYFCELASKNTINNAVVVKNLGIAYERNGNLEEALKKYLESVEIDPYNYKSRLCLASAYIKQAQNILGISKERDKLLCNFIFSDEQIQKATAWLDKSESQIEHLKRIDSKLIDAYYKEGEILTYRYLLSNKRAKLAKRAFRCFEIANTFNTTFLAHKFHERNFYEALGKIDRAKEINSILSGADVSHIEKLYNKKATNP